MQNIFLHFLVPFPVSYHQGARLDSALQFKPTLTCGPHYSWKAEWPQIWLIPGKSRKWKFAVVLLWCGTGRVITMLRIRLPWQGFRERGKWLFPVDQMERKNKFLSLELCRIGHFSILKVWLIQDCQCFGRSNQWIPQIRTHPYEPSSYRRKRPKGTPLRNPLKCIIQQQAFTVCPAMGTTYSARSSNTFHSMFSLLPHPAPNMECSQRGWKENREAEK